MADSPPTEATLGTRALGAASGTALGGDALDAFLAGLADARDAASGALHLTEQFARTAGARRALLYVLGEDGALTLAATTDERDAPTRMAPTRIAPTRIAADEGAGPLFAAANSLFALAGTAHSSLAGLGAGPWLALPLPQPRSRGAAPPFPADEAVTRAGDGWRVVTPRHGERRRRIGLTPLGIVVLQIDDDVDVSAVVETLMPAATLAGPILARSLAVEQYRETAERLDLIFEYVADPIVVADATGKITQANPQAERLLTDANLRTFSSFVDAFLRSGEPSRRGRLTFAHPTSGAPLPLEVVAGTAGRGGPSGGEPDVVVSVLHDLTTQAENERLYEELKRFSAVLEQRVRAATADLAEQNARLERQSEELERASRLKSEFLANMSHELRTPINALIGYTALLRDRVYGELNPKQQDGLRRIQTSAEHLLALINDILDLARIEAGRMPVHFERVLMAPVLRDSAHQAELASRAKGLAFTLDIPAEPLYVRTDPDKLRQVLVNLLSNAVKFTPQGRVTLRATADGERVRVEVEDTGIGIASDDLSLIWEDFRQLDQSRTREYGGTGLGLSIVRKLAERLDATVDVRSEPGKGSVFSVSIPSASEEPPPLPSDPPAA